MEKEIIIKTSNKKVIYGIFRGSFKQPVIVLVHGLAGNMNEALHYNAARFFEKHGFATLRFNLYFWQKDARKLHECTFKTHGKDIDVVTEYLKTKGVKRIFIVGHSYGFPSILFSNNKNFTAGVSWDGSVLPKNHVDISPKIQKPKGRIIDDGYFIIVGEKMAKDSRKTSSLTLLREFRIPIKFITVSSTKDGNLEGAKQMYKNAHEPKEIKMIKGAQHNFTEDGKQEKLYSETVKWFKKFI
jgi:dienelactone hydrolase